MVSVPGRIYIRHAVAHVVDYIVTFVSEIFRVELLESIFNTGTVWTWIWDVRLDAPKDPPAAVAELAAVTAVALGSEDGLMVLKADGTVWVQQGFSLPQQIPAPA